MSVRFYLLKWISETMIFLLSYLSEFVAKASQRGIFFSVLYLMKSISDFPGDLEEESLLCPVRALRFYLCGTSDLSLRPHSLCLIIVLQGYCQKMDCCPFLCEVVSNAGAVGGSEGCFLRAHSIRCHHID